MINFKNKRFSIFLFLSYLFSLVFAGIELPNCPSDDQYNLMYMYDCSNKSFGEFNVTNYCIRGSILYVFGDNGIPVCGHYFKNYYNIVEVKNSDIKDVTLSTNDLTIDYSLDNIGIVICNFYYNVFTCGQTTGIVRDKTLNYYNIYKNSTTVNEKAKSYRSSCYTGPGKVITKNKQVEFCVTKDYSVPISALTAGYYMMDGTDDKESPFATPQKNNVLIRFYQDIAFLDYVDYITDYYLNYETRELTDDFEIGTFYEKLYSCGSGVCSEGKYSIVESTSTFMYKSDKSTKWVYHGRLYKFEKNKKGLVYIYILNETGVMAFTFDSDDVGIKVEDNDFTSGLVLTPQNINTAYLFYCQNGDCTQTYGYLKYKSSTNSISVVECTDNCSYANMNYNSCVSGGFAYYDTSSQSMKLCVVDKSGNINSIDIKGNGHQYGFNYDTKSGLYNLFESDKMGNIVAYSKGSGIIMKDINGDSVNDVVMCEGSDDSSAYCNLINGFKGYAVNMAAEDANELIHCNDELVCDVVKKDNGYFMNNQNQLIKCSEGVCKLDVSYVSYCDNGEVINSGSYKSPTLCAYGKIIPLITNTNNVYNYNDYNYYIIDKIDTKYTYPNVVQGNDTIIIRSDQYAVIQVTTGEDGFCFDVSTKKISSDSTCDSIELKKYYCASICTSCTNEKKKKVKYVENQNNPSSCTNFIEDSLLNSGALSNYKIKLSFIIAGIVSLILML
ncbi:hypothetical protein BCR32DRAFT_271456 [Anaeromyces robustus]|uniref:Scaffoldin n=1 Tax=Anaeromyces robustus TaxID=1754192 RepID=A0A1Y1WRI8_9FUNG|nr:hypothetical protein BCR32DRAFT_271456 [Anaeromyces robustus]|eukprot:ORX76149.1 hypothetical protein BCR32DRAFT_271456 [Anaeromyces robustus]